MATDERSVQNVDARGCFVQSCAAAAVAIVSFFIGAVVTVIYWQQIVAWLITFTG